MFKRVLIANRGEIAIRIARAASSLGVDSVAVFTPADSLSLHTRLAGAAREIADAWKPWIETCINAFGAERCMFESNFPVDKLSTGYAVLWNAFKLMAAGASAAEKSALFSGAARRVYRLP